MYNNVYSILYLVLPRIPQDLDYTDSKHRSVKLCWEQEYRNEDEEPSEYHVTVAEEAELCGPIVPTVSKLFPAKYMYTCEYTLRGLEPSKSYTVGITVNNKDGAVHSDEVTIITTRKSITYFVIYLLLLLVCCSLPCFENVSKLLLCSSSCS